MPLPIHRCLIVAALAGVSACSGAPTPEDHGSRYDLQGRYSSDMIVRQTSYRGSMDVATSRGGALSGTLRLTTPIPITAELTGHVLRDSIAFGGPYRTPECTGVLRGRGRIAEGGRTAWGDVNIDDGCVGAMAGSFRLAK
jgi:hypothetical protein